MNSYIVSWIVILFDEQLYYFIFIFQVYKNMLLHRKENIIKIYILFLVLSSYFFRNLKGLVVS
jgi:hypothetical protein